MRTLQSPSTGPVRNLLIAAIALSIAPTVCRAQVSISPLTGAAARADALRERATSLFEFPTRYREASLLLRQAAALRDAADDRATEELLLAGRLSYYARDWGTAQRTFEEGGERALEAGQLTIAANAWVDAAFSALARKDQEDAFGYVRRAQRLADSPHIALEERNEILGRIGPVRVALAGVGGR